MSEPILDSERWEALMDCERFRVMGSARIGTDDPHIGLEIWAKYPADHMVDGGANHIASRQALTEFVDGIILAKRAQQQERRTMQGMPVPDTQSSP